MKRWSKLKKKIEDVFLPEVGLQIHCNVYSSSDKHHTFESPRTWLQCDKQIIFDFPGMFFFWKSPLENSAIYYMESDASDPGRLIDEYLATPKSDLADKQFPDDRWGFTELLKIADRRIGKARLEEKFSNWPVGTPIGTLLRKRLTGEACVENQPVLSKFLDLESDFTGLSKVIQVKSKPTQAGFVLPSEVASVRVIVRLPPLATPIFNLRCFALEVSDSPEALMGHRNWYEFTSFPKADLQAIKLWIARNRAKLIEFWNEGGTWSAEEIGTWKSGLK